MENEEEMRMLRALKSVFFSRKPPCPYGIAYHLPTARHMNHPRITDRRLPGKGNSNSHGARPVYLIIVDSDQSVVNNEVSL